ncbi:DUF4214 domain-containing protein [Alteromonas sp. B31-7]|uniref:DUF4214 domain-containing protein n=1 Tax=Alteromonas sp. B31-7 TaxID=2785913 RepID=UPI0018C8D97C|nr:DUF4214 domain-containing protein [Alteromonas sp. B31-7]QPL50562.1 hypothetical protein IUA53_02595 [Alteromonas sp. B31-7]
MFVCSKTDLHLKVEYESDDNYNYAFGLVFGLKTKFVKLAEKIDDKTYEVSFSRDLLEDSNAVICLETGWSFIFEDSSFDSSLLTTMETKELESNYLRHAEYIPLDRMIDLLYRDILNRSSDEPGLNSYLESSKGFHSTEEFLNVVRSSLLSSKEFESRGITIFDRLHTFFDTNENLIEREFDLNRHYDRKGKYSYSELKNLDFHNFIWFLYRNLLFKEPDFEGFTYYHWLLSSGLSSRIGLINKIISEFNVDIYIQEMPEDETVSLLLSDSNVDINKISMVLLGRKLSETETEELATLEIGEVITYLISKREYFYKPIKVELL